jgi:hypothetical protein
MTTEPTREQIAMTPLLIALNQIREAALKAHGRNLDVGWFLDIAQMAEKAREQARRILLD